MDSRAVPPFSLEADAERRVSIAFLNWAHALDHFVMLRFPTVVIGLELVYARPYSELIVLSTASCVAFGVCSLPAGWLADHWSRRNMMVLFYFGCGASLVGAAFAPNLVMLALALFVLGVFAAIYHPVGMAMLIEASKARGRTLAFNGVCGNLGAALAAGITAVLASTLSWRRVPGAGGFVHRHRRRISVAGRRRRPSRRHPEIGSRSGVAACARDPHAGAVHHRRARGRHHLQYHVGVAAEDRGRAPGQGRAAGRGRGIGDGRFPVRCARPARGRAPRRADRPARGVCDRRGPDVPRRAVGRLCHRPGVDGRAGADHGRHLRPGNRERLGDRPLYRRPLARTHLCGALFPDLRLLRRGGCRDRVPAQPRRLCARARRDRGHCARLLGRDRGDRRAGIRRRTPAHAGYRGGGVIMRTGRVGKGAECVVPTDSPRWATAPTHRLAEIEHPVLRRCPPYGRREHWKAKGPGLRPGLVSFRNRRPDQKSMSPMPPPGPPGIGGDFFLGSSATIASVVTSRPATLAASWSAARTTLVGSMMPFDTRLPNSPVWASKP